MESGVPVSTPCERIMNWLTLEPQLDEFCSDVLTGLSSQRKAIPSKYLYDQRGSELFDRICEVDEYYVTRTETAIMRSHASSMARTIGPHVCLVELGSGSSLKTRLLLGQLEHITAYVPFDISSDYLQSSCCQLQQEFPWLTIRPHVGDFTEELTLPGLSALDQPDKCPRVLYYFPGSTVGNLTSQQTMQLCERMIASAPSRCGLLIGIDLVKDPGVIEAAYDDAAGVTAAFSKNLLQRINRELSGNFIIDQFEHHAAYDRHACCVDIGLRSLAQQQVSVAGHSFGFKSGEMIHTEVSRKYQIDEFSRLMRRTGFQLQESWSDPQHHFAVLYLTADRARRL